MENIFEVIGSTISFGDGKEYYVLNCKRRGLYHYCFGMNTEKQPFEKREQIVFEAIIIDDELKGRKYEGEDYQSILEEFLETDNLRQSLRFMDAQRETLSKEPQARLEDVFNSMDTVSDEETADALAAFEKLAEKAAFQRRKLKSRPQA